MAVRYIFAGLILVVMLLEPLLARGSQLRVDSEQPGVIQVIDQA